MDHVVNLKMPDGVGVGAKVPGLYPIMSSTKGSLSGITAWGAVYNWDANKDSQYEIHPKDWWLQVKRSELRLLAGPRPVMVMMMFLYETEMH